MPQICNISQSFATFYILKAWNTSKQICCTSQIRPFGEYFCSLWKQHHGVTEEILWRGTMYMFIYRIKYAKFKDHHLGVRNTTNETHGTLGGSVSVMLLNTYCKLRGQDRKSSFQSSPALETPLPPPRGVESTIPKPNLLADFLLLLLR